VLYWKVQVGGIKRLNQQVLFFSGQNFTWRCRSNGSSFQYDKLGAPRNERLEFWLCRCWSSNWRNLKGNVSLGSLRVRQDYLIAQGLPFENDDFPSDNRMLQMALQRLKQLAAHEWDTRTHA
jgi:hypothetical protein